MWHSPTGKTTFTGPFALVLAHGIWTVTSALEACLDDDDPYAHGHQAFDRLTDEQKIWSLYKVAFGLLDSDTDIVPLTAYLEATIATIFRQVEEDIDGEIHEAECEPDGGHYSLRSAIVAAYELAGGNDPENIMEGEAPLTATCDDLDEWLMAMEILEGNILWDADYDSDVFDDMPPEHGKLLRDEAGIADDYYVAVPNDPKREEALTLLKKTRSLCDLVIAREEKLLKQ